MIGVWIWIAFSLGCCTRPPMPKNLASESPGMIDLRAWDFKKQKIIALKGSWEFYWQTLLNPDDFSTLEQVSDYVHLPHVWNKSKDKNDEVLGGQGFATYRIKILIDEEAPTLALKTENYSSAVAIFVNGQLINKVGQVGKTKETSKSAYEAGVYVIPSEGSTVLEIVIQISNFSHRKGGLWKRIYLGEEKSLIIKQDYEILITLFLFGSILTMAFYNLAIYFLRRVEQTSLYFALLCFTISLRIISSDKYYLQDLIPISWVWLLKVEYIAFYLSVGFMATFAQATFPKEFSKLFLRFCQGFALLYTVLTLLLPTLWHTQLVFYYQVFTLIGGTYFSYVLIQANLNRSTGAVVFALAWVLLFATAINDILHSMLKIRTGYYASFGFFIFIYAQSIYLSRRFAKAVKEAGLLGRALAVINQDLEYKVTERFLRLEQENARLRSTNQAMQRLNQEMTTNIEYAKNIQQAIIPSVEKIKEVFPVNFMINEPKQIVSGDCYWLGREGDKIIFALLDCTGHGVPGALMSLVGSDLMNQIVHYDRIADAQEILSELDKRLQKTLSAKEMGIRDGIDIGIVVIDYTYLVLEFAGARHSLFYIQNEQFKEIKGTARSVGGIIHKEGLTFEKHPIDISEPTVFYLFTDGLTSQLGGPKGRKYSLSRFKALIEQMKHFTLNYQEKIIRSELKEWRLALSEKTNQVQSYEQTDDILIVGIKI